MALSGQDFKDLITSLDNLRKATEDLRRALYYARRFSKRKGV